MKLAQFISRWPNTYSPEQEQTYRVLHGDDRSAWPKHDDPDKITIDLDKIARFNPSVNEGEMTVELSCGGAYNLSLSYEEFKSILTENHIEITDYSEKCLTQ